MTVERRRDVNSDDDEKDGIALYMSEARAMHRFIRGMMISNKRPIVVASASEEAMERHRRAGVNDTCKSMAAYLGHVSGCPVPPDLCVNCEKPTEHGPGSLCDACLRLG